MGWRRLESLNGYSIMEKNYTTATDSWGERKAFYYDDGIVLAEVAYIEQSLYEALRSIGNDSENQK